MVVRKVHSELEDKPQEHLQAFTNPIQKEIIMDHNRKITMDNNIQEQRTEKKMDLTTSILAN